MDMLGWLLDPSNFPPRWRCGVGWANDPWLGWLHILSDLGVWTAYVSIPFVLVYFAAQRKDLPFRRIFILFAAFILLCGTTHLMEAIIFWWPAYRLAGAIKLVTAIVSWLTVLALIRMVPLMLTMRSPEELERQVQERTRELSDSVIALRDERELLRVTLESIGDGVIVTDMEGKIRFLNPVAQELTGVDQEQAAQRPLESVFKVIQEESREAVQTAAERVLRDGRVKGFSTNAILVAQDGTERPIDESAAPIRDANGEVSGSVLTFRDVSERRAQERELAAKEEQLRMLVESVPLLCWMANPDGHIFWYNRRWFEYTGTELEDMVGWGWQRVHAPESLPAVTERWQQSLASGEPFEMIFPLRAADGSYRRFLTRALPMMDGDGRVMRWFGTNTDVEDAERSAAAATLLANAGRILSGLHDLKTTLSEVASQAVPLLCDYCVIDLLDDDGQIQRVAVCHSDKSKEPLIRELQERYPASWNPDSLVVKAIRSGEAQLLHSVGRNLLESVAENPEHLKLLVALNPTSAMVAPLMVRGKTFGAIAFVRSDVSTPYVSADLDLGQEVARRAATAIDNAMLYENLCEADRRKDEFLATLAHELRNPLAPIRNGLELVRIAPNTEVIEQARSMMERQVNQLVRLVDDLMDVSRISRGKLALRTETVDLAKVVESAIETSRPLFEELRHEVVVTMPRGKILIEADVIRLAQAFLNLLNNAAKYSDPGSQIDLVVERLEDTVSISVIDRGIGIERDQLRKIFDLFSQVDRSLEKSRGGLGIGLTLVKQLVTMHGGEVEARSDGPGRGARFIVRLPISPASLESVETDRAPLDEIGRGMRVLVVDDNRDSADSLTLMLQFMGYQTRTAYDGESAVQVTAEFVPDVILLDIGLPKLNGYDACRAIRAANGGRKLVIIAQTGWGQEEDRERTRSAGFDHHLVKPIDAEQLVELLQSFTGVGTKSVARGT